MDRERARDLVENLLDASHQYEMAIDRDASEKARAFYLEWKEKVILALSRLEK